MPVRPPHFLLASVNTREMKANLEGTLRQASIAVLEEAIVRNAQQLVALARDHLSFACQQRQSWRHCVSRLYYAAFNASRAARLFDSGQYSQEPEDHKRIGELPAGIRGHQRFRSDLDLLRRDRNLCDYDHTAAAADLTKTVDEWAELVTEFVEGVENFVAGHGGIQ